MTQTSLNLVELEHSVTAQCHYEQFVKHALRFTEISQDHRSTVLCTQKTPELQLTVMSSC